MQRRGQSNIVTFLFVAGGALALYAAIIFVPAWLDNLSVKEAVAIQLNKGYTVPDENRTESIINYVNYGPTAAGYHFEESPDGERIEVRGLGLTPENITYGRDDSSRTLTIYVDYTRELQLKPFNKIKLVTFHVEKANTYQ